MPSIPELHTTSYSSRTVLGRTETRTRPTTLDLANQAPRPGRIDPNQGPAIVFITPPSSPRREAIYDPGSEVSVDTSDPLSETMRRQFRIINPDPEPDQVPTFVYTPPPLPNTNSGSLYSSQLAPPSLHYLPASSNHSNPLTTLSTSIFSNQPEGHERLENNRNSHLHSTVGSNWLNPEGASEDDTDSDTGGTYFWKKPPLDFPMSAESTRSRFSQSENPRSPSRFSVSSRWKGKTPNRASIQQNEQDMTWATRPPPETVYGHLQEFFPDHDVDKVVIDVGEVDLSQPEDNNVRKQRVKKSIRMVAEEQVNRNVRLGSRRRTKLWDSNVEELRM